MTFEKSSSCSPSYPDDKKRAGQDSEGGGRGLPCLLADSSFVRVVDQAMGTTGILGILGGTISILDGLLGACGTVLEAPQAY